MSKYKQDGRGGIFNYLSKKAVRPLGFKRIRTSTGSFKSFSRSARGKRFPIFSKLRKRSSKNLKTKLNYMNERISGKTQKIEHYAARLKEAQILSASKRRGLEARKKLFTKGSEEWNKIEKKIKKLDDNLEKQLPIMTQKIEKAKKNLTIKLNKYKPKQEKYEKLMQRKIYKSQKRLEKGFTKSCKNLKKTGQSSIGCLEAYEICKGKHANLDLKGLTACINMESENMGLPSNLKEGQITETMTALANKHFIRRFKRRRHLREIKRISKHGDQLEKSLKNTKGTIRYGEKLEGHSMNGTQQSFNKLGELSKERVIYKNVAKNNPGLSLAELEKKTYEKIDKTQITQTIREENPGVVFTPDELKKHTDDVYTRLSAAKTGSAVGVPGTGTGAAVGVPGTGTGAAVGVAGVPGASAAVGVPGTGTGAAVGVAGVPGASAAVGVARKGPVKKISGVTTGSTGTGRTTAVVSRNPVHNPSAPADGYMDVGPEMDV
jgi:hypothetical protein